MAKEGKYRAKLSDGLYIMAIQRAMSNLPVENIVSAYLSQAIRAIEDKNCSWCKDGNWRVVLIMAIPEEGDSQAFLVKCAVQCQKCLALEKKEWPFNPTIRKEVVKPEKINE